MRALPPTVLLLLLLLRESTCFKAPTQLLLLRPATCVLRQSASPLLLAKKKAGGKKKKKKPASDGGGISAAPLPLMVPDDASADVGFDVPAAVGGGGSAVPSPPAAAAASSGWREVLSDEGETFYYNDATGVSQWEAPEAPAPAPAPVPATAFAFDAPTTMAGSAGGAAGFDEENEELPRFDGGLLPFGDGMPKLSLPSFDDYKKGPKKELPADDDDRYRSKLTPINQGKSLYEEYGIEEPEEKPFLEKWVFRLTWGGIFFLVFIEIFINTPVFQQIRPAILNFLADGDGGYQ